MSKFKRGLTVDRDVEDPMRRPRPVSQEGYYYPEEHINDKNFLHPNHTNSRRQPMRQYGSSASLEMHQERNRQQREQEFFSPSPSAIRKQPSFEYSQNTSATQSNFRNADPSVYYQQSTRRANQSSGNNRRLPPQNIIIPRSVPNSSHPSNSSNNTIIPRSVPNSNHPSNNTVIPRSVPNLNHPSNSSNNTIIPRSVPNLNHPSNSSNSYGNNTYNTYNTYLKTNKPNKPPYHSNSSNLLIPQSHLPNNSRQMFPPNHYPNSAPQLPMQQPIRDNSHRNLRRTPSQESLADPFVASSPLPNSRGLEQYQTSRIPPEHNDRSQQQHYSSKNQNKIKESPIVNKNKSDGLDLPDPVSIDDYVSQAIKYHEDNQLVKSTEYLKIAAEKGSPVGVVLYGMALRHGWGCNANAAAAFKYLQQAAESAMNILNGINKTVSMSPFKGELVLAIYELGVCFRHGWGVPKSKATAAYYFEISANLGDPDAQNDIALCYHKGEGVKKDMKMAAKYYRMADAQGHGTMGNSWIFKEKYNSDKK